MVKTMVKSVSRLLFTALLVANLSLLSLGLKSQPKETYSSDASLFSYNSVKEEIYFSEREEEYIETSNGVPLYTQLSSLENSCGPTAGAIIIGFYDKYYEDLIPNFRSYFPATGNYLPNDRTYVPALMQDLYVKMKTNVADVGVNEVDCLSGLKQYVNDKNLSFSYSSVQSGSNLNETRYTNALRENKPALLFNNTTDVFQFSTNNGVDVFSSSTISGNHIYVAYGFYKVKYILTNGNERVDTYARVACGLSFYTDAFIRLSSTTVSVPNQWLNSAYSISIS